MNQETKDLIDQGKMLPLMEEFYTIQGEGYHTEIVNKDPYGKGWMIKISFTCF